MSFSIEKWLRQLGFAGRGHVPSRKKRSAPLAVEALEDRLTPNGTPTPGAWTVITNTDAGGPGGVGTLSLRSGDLRFCINEAILAGGTDTISFSPTFFTTAKTITLSNTDTDPNSANVFGPTDFTIAAVNLTINGPSAGVAINGANLQRLFAVTSSATLALNALTLENGTAQGGNGGAPTSGGGGGGGGGLGGAVFNQGTLILQASTLTGNQAIGGQGSSGTSAGGEGGFGGGPNGGTELAYGSPGGAGGFGGGVAGGGGNIKGGGNGGQGGFGAGGGGAGDFLVGGSTFGAGGFGGGNGGVVAPPNFAGSGGGGAGLGGAVFNNAGTVTITNSTFTANTATGGSGFNAGTGLGGAVFSRNGAVTAKFDTFSSNTVTNGDSTPGAASDVYVLSDTSASSGSPAGSGTATAKLVNDILGQTSKTVTDFAAGTNGPGAIAPTFTGSSNDLVRCGGAPLGAAVISTADPQLNPPANNGGPTPTMSLKSTSPALLKGVPLSDITTDQRGQLRTNPPDLGAYEFDIPLPLSKAAGRYH